MLTEERYDRILEILDEENYCTAESLSKRLFVSMPTIRRDLAELKRRNLIVRSHGGAKRLNSENTVSPLSFRKEVNMAVKKKLCRAAGELISDNDIIFIDASTTAFHIADHISPDKSVTVVTNSIPLMLYLSKKGIKTYSTGGLLQENSMCYAGSYAEEFVRGFNFDIAFFSSYGLNEKGIICDTSESETALRRAVLKQTQKSVFMCDKSKIFLSAPFNLTELNAVDCFVTDKQQARKLLSEWEKCNVIEVEI